MSEPKGKWDETLDGVLNIVGVHAIVLHTGDVLYFSFDSRAVNIVVQQPDEFVRLFNNPELGSYQIWHPATRKADPVKQIGRNAFCAGQCQLGDGTILVAGGQDQFGAMELYTNNWFQGLPSKLEDWLVSWFTGTDNGALWDLHTYDPIADEWLQWPELQSGRYYPTCATLHDGTGFIAGGLSHLQQWVASGAADHAENDQLETVLPGELFAGTTHQQHFEFADQYPLIRQLPGSHTLFVHVGTETSLFDLDSMSFIQDAEFAAPGVGMQTYPMQSGHVLLPQREGDAPQILIVGGSTAQNFDYNTHHDAPAVKNAFIFSFDHGSPGKSSWRTTKQTPNVARLLADTVLLPDGTVFIVNGIKGGAAAGHAQSTVNFAEIFDPADESFMVMAEPDSTHPRGYHSTAVLLPDATVAIAGNTGAYNDEEQKLDRDDCSIQVFRPPYLFSSARPVVSGVPGKITYGSVITVSTSAAAVTKAMLMRPCAVTHSVDMDQRAIVLDVKAGVRPDTIDVTLPSDKSLAPPGYYMLFFLSKDGVPSVASFARLFDETPEFFPLDLGTYEGDCVIDEAFDGDLTLEKIDQHCKVTLESRHGSITIKHKIDQHSYANLKAAKGVFIGEKIDQLSRVRIEAGGDVKIGQSIDAGASVVIDAKGAIDIGLKLDAYSGAQLTAGKSVRIGETIDQHSNANIVAGGDIHVGLKIDAYATANLTSSGGSVRVGQTIDQHAIVAIKAAATVDIGLKIDQHAVATIEAGGDIHIGQKLDQHTTSTITSTNGSVTVVQGMSGNATATIEAPNGRIKMNTIDGGCTLKWHAQQLDCPNQNGAVTRI